MGTLEPAPTPVKPGESVSVAGVSYLVRSLHAEAFPQGALTVILFTRQPTSALSKPTCQAVRAAEWASVAMHIAARFKPLAGHYADLVATLQGATGGKAFVRAGATRLAGAATPADLPKHGTVSYHGRRWSVFSWQPIPPVRVYLMTPNTR
jgi:hypothetical protein